MRPALLAVVAAAFGLGACERSSSPDEAPGPPARALVAEPADPVKAGRTPVDVAVDGDTVWVLDQADGRLSRYAAGSGRRQGSAPVGRSPLALAVGEGSVWVLDAGSGVRRVDPATGRPLGQPVPVPDPAGLAVGAGAVWVTSRTAGSLTRIDASTLRRDPPIQIGGAPGDVVVAGGYVWVAQTDVGSVMRIDAGTGRPAAPVELAAGQTLALAADERGLYAAVSKTRLNDALQVMRIDTRTAEVIGTPVPITGGVPLRLAARDGSVWATDIGSSLPGSARREPALLRIDDSSRSAERVATVPGRPSSVATGPGAVWVTDSTRGTLTRVDLR